MSSHKEKPVVLLRAEFDSDAESVAAVQSFPVVGLRTLVPPNSLVIGRYACLPYYRELSADLAHNGSELINSLEQHCYIANFDYYEDIREHTFPTWLTFQDVPPALRADQAFIVKGRTNSRKFQWATHMFAPTWSAAVRLGGELANDPFIGPQGLIIRQYVPLETFEMGINDMPITNEWRLFFYKTTLLASGYYWAIVDDEAKVDAAREEFDKSGIAFATAVAEILAKRVNFFVIDIARTQSGEWVAVEVNDAQQSGLNHFVSAEELYSNLATALAEEARFEALKRIVGASGAKTGRTSSREPQPGGTPKNGAPLPARCQKCGEMDFRHPYRNCDTPELS